LMATSNNASKNYFVVLNPNAGHGKAVSAAPRIEAYLKDRGVNYRLRWTKAPGDAIKIVQDADLDSDTVVVAAGGDGTCNEVVNGLMLRADKDAVQRTFGLLPIGRGNDFAYSARVSTELPKALDTLLRGRATDLDVGWVKGGFFPDGRFFVNGVGIGFDTKVGFEAARMKHVKSGIAYAFGAIATLLKFERPPLVEITRDDQCVTQHCLIISIMNGRRMGGTFFMAPRARLDDGFFDICTIGKVKSRSRLLKAVLCYTTGTQEQLAECSMTKAAAFLLRALEGGLAAHADGETVCYDGKDLELGCVPKALRLIGDGP
jgi:YegS/Rv2252/BmrU family lipid kinase